MIQRGGIVCRQDAYKGPNIKQAMDIRGSSYELVRSRSCSFNVRVPLRQSVSEIILLD